MLTPLGPYPHLPILIIFFKNFYLGANRAFQQPIQINPSNKLTDYYLISLKPLFRNIYQDNIELVIFGEKKNNETYINGFKITNIGYLNDEESLAMLYSSADLVIVPSRQESFSQVCLESISCGTPVVAFDYSGPRDIIQHQTNGYLAKPYDPKDLAIGIEWILQSLSKSNELSLKAREIAIEKFDIKKVAQSHIELYNRILLN
mgnify:CR=1 FL=1